jgi:hypothetical protein
MPEFVMDLVCIGLAVVFFLTSGWLVTALKNL